MNRKLLGLTLVVNLSVACAPPPSKTTLVCGEGTTERDGACVTALRCATGTHEEGGACIADPTTPVACGAGTHLDGNECVIDPPPTPPPSPWSAPVPVCASGVACTDPVLVQSPGGALVAVSESDDASMSVAVYRQGPTGFTLSKRFEGSSRVALNPTLALRGATLFLVYTDYTPSGGQDYGPGDLMLATSGDFGETWTAPRRINPMPATTLLYAPQLVASAAGLDLVYVDTDGRTTQDNLYVHSDDDGMTFSAPTPLPSGGQYDSLSVAARPVRVGDSLELPMLRSGYDLSSGGRLSSVEVLSLSPGAQPQPRTERIKRVYASRDFPLDPVPVLAASDPGVRCLAFVDAPSRDFGVFVVRSEGALDASQRAHLLPGGPGSVQTAPAVAVTPSGDCAVAWLDNRSGAWELYETVMRADGSWQQPVKVTPTGFTEDGVTKTLAAKVQLQVDATGRRLVWSDFRDGKESLSFSAAP
ncbi:MAG: sialidase family protein [Myxococcota bacterium]